MLQRLLIDTRVYSVRYLESDSSVFLSSFLYFEPVREEYTKNSDSKKKDGREPDIAINHMLIRKHDIDIQSDQSDNSDATFYITSNRVCR